MNKTALHLAILALTTPMSLYALGLGKMTVKSALDQPFLAEIELIDVRSVVMAGVRVGVADPENFEQIGMERAAVLSLLKFSIVKNEQGKNVIKVESQERMSDPYMELVVDLTWPTGQLFKAYTVLLDPPGYQLVSTTAQSSPTHYKKVSGYSNEPGVVETTVISSVEKNPVTANDGKKKATYGPTITNENVWQIAQRYKTSEITLPQIVLAIVGANPEAFTEGNLNGLKVGVRLVIPSTEEALQVPADLATEEVMAHDKAWNEKTAINHVLTPPYMTGSQPTTNPTPIPHSEVPAIPKFSADTIPVQGAAPQLITSQSVVPVIPVNPQPVPVKKPQTSEQEAKTNAELSITTAAVESVRESNALLMEQLHLLQDQNKKLQAQLDKRDKQMELIRVQMETMMKERMALAAQASSSNANTQSSGYWPLFLLLLLAAGGGGYAYWYYRLREQDVDSSSYVVEQVSVEPEVVPVETPQIPVVEQSIAEASEEPPKKRGRKKKVTEEAVELSTVEPEVPLVEPITTSLETGPEKIELELAPVKNDHEEVVLHENTDNVASQVASEQVHPSEGPLEFETGLYDAEGAQSQLVKTIPDELPSEDSSIDFVIAPVGEEEHLEEPTHSDDEIADSVHEVPDEDVMPSEEESKEITNVLKSTKALTTLLDLARTYIGMDDYISARQSLQEVLEHGSQEQKDEAQKLLDQIKDK